MEDLVDLSVVSKNKNMSTGSICQVSGLYKCSKHPHHEITMVKGKEFPPCGKDGGHSTNWILVTPTPH